MDLDQPPVVRAYADPDQPPLDPDGWPMTVPAVARVVSDGFVLSPGVTFLVGENGSGKSTIVEAVAMAFGLSPEGGSTQGAHSTRPSESGLVRVLRLERGLGSSRWGFFLRAETMHGWYTYLEDTGRELPGDQARNDPAFHEMSHGESFLEVLRTRFTGSGFYCLDEPEAALSFSSVLGLVSELHDVVLAGGQVLCATHSPCWPPCPAPGSSRSASGACARPRGTSSSWCSTGRPTSTLPPATCVTCSRTDRRVPLTARSAR